MRTNRVLIIGPFAAGQLAASLARAFERRGARVVPFDSDRAYMTAMPGAASRLVRRTLRPALWRRMNRQTIDLVSRTRPDLVVAVKGTYLHAETVRVIRRSVGIPICNYYPDNPYCGVPWNPRRTSAQRRDLVSVLREYTRVWIWHRGLASRLANDGVAASYLPFGVDPELSATMPQAPCADCGTRHGLVFVGNHCDKREAHLAAVRRHRVALWGGRWRRAETSLGRRHVIHDRPLVAAACSSVYSVAAVALNVLSDLNMPGHNMRTFEIPGSGGLMLSTYTDEQAAFFPEGEAAVYYRHPSELDDQIDRILCDRVWATRVRTRAASIAAAHTYAARVTTMLEELRAS